MFPKAPPQERLIYIQAMMEKIQRDAINAQQQQQIQLQQQQQAARVIDLFFPSTLIIRQS